MLVKMYRAAQQWNQWVAQPQGRCVLNAEKIFLQKALATFYGKHGMLIGVPAQGELLQASVAAQQTVLTPLINKNSTVETIESDFTELPVATGSVNLVFLPHLLEYVDNPRQLLTEACRIVKPEGHIVILGFNPHSGWGLKKILSRKKGAPWKNYFIQHATLKKWLKLLDFELAAQDFLMYGMPMDRYRSNRFIEWIGHTFIRPLGGIYVLIAQAKTSPLTPIRLRWKQSFSNIRISIPRHSMRKF